MCKMRRRHPKFPQVEVRKTGAIIQPATRVHVGKSLAAIEKFAEEFEQYG